MDKSNKPQKESFQEFHKRFWEWMDKVAEENSKLTQEELDKKYGM